MDSLKSALIFLWKKFLDLVYPRQCEICKCLNGDIICERCYLEIQNIERTQIKRYKNKSFNEHLYIFKYEGKIRNILIDYKFNDKGYLYEFFEKIILKNEKIATKIKSYDIMIPVPIHIKRKRQRGYNQSELIAKNVANRFEELEYLSNVLVKTKHTVRQSELSKKERKQNARRSI